MGNSSGAKRKRLCSSLLVLILLASLVGVCWRQPSQAAGAQEASAGDTATAAIEAAKRELWNYQLAFLRDGVAAGWQKGLEATPLPAAASALATAAGTRWWGMQLYNPGDLRVTELQQLEAGWLRVPFGWRWIEPINTTPENYGWSAGFDAQLAQLSASNIKVILTLMGNPSWAATYEAGPIDKVDISELVQFMEAAVAHYGAPPYNVKHWEIYNEPDNARESRAEHGGWGYFGDQPEKYVEVLAALYQPMKRVDPQAQIVFGGMAYDGWDNGFEEEFLDNVLALGGGAYFDYMNFHYFTYYKELWDPYGIDVIGKANYIRNKMTSFQVAKPIVVTEACRGSNPGFGSEELQSRYIVQLYARSRAAGLSFTVWWWLLDFSTIREKCGMLRPDGTPKPAWYAYQTLARQLTAAEYVRTLPSTETGSSKIEAYEFRTGDRAYRIVVAWTNDDRDHDVSLTAEYALVVDKYGNGTEVRDGDDGQMDGRLQVTLGPSPLYVRLQPEYRLAITTTGSGTVQREPDQAAYQYGAVVTLTPLPAATWSFDRWAGDNAVELVAHENESWSLKMDGDKALTAVFRRGAYTLTLDISGEGTVNLQPTGPFWEGEVVRLTPVPEVGWLFDRWGGANAAEPVNNRDGSWSLTMDADKALTAEFVQAQYDLTVTVLGQGEVDYRPGPYHYGDLATLTPAPAEGWTFRSWRGANGAEVVPNDDNTWSITMNANKTVTAAFSQDAWFLQFFPVVSHGTWR